MTGKAHWTVDRRIPLALVATIVIQTITLVWIGAWYASEFSSRIKRNAEVIRETRVFSEQNLAAQKARIDAIERRQSAADTVAARLEERLAAQGQQLDRIERLLDRLYRRLEPPRNDGR